MTEQQEDLDLALKGMSISFSLVLLVQNTLTLNAFLRGSALTYSCKQFEIQFPFELQFPRRQQSRFSKRTWNPVHGTLYMKVCTLHKMVEVQFNGMEMVKEEVFVTSMFSLPMKNL